MIPRYSRPAMRAIWTEENKFNAYLKVEILSAEAWRELGVVPAEDIDRLWENASFNAPFSADSVKNALLPHHEL